MDTDKNTPQSTTWTGVEVAKETFGSDLRTTDIHEVTYVEGEKGTGENDRMLCNANSDTDIVASLATATDGGGSCPSSGGTTLEGQRYKVTNEMNHAAKNTSAQLTASLEEGSQTATDPNANGEATQGYQENEAHNDMDTDFQSMKSSNGGSQGLSNELLDRSATTSDSGKANERSEGIVETDRSANDDVNVDTQPLDPEVENYLDNFFLALLAYAHPTHATIGNVVISLWAKKYCYQDHTWYQYVKHCWKQLPNGNDITNCIMHELVPCIIQKLAIMNTDEVLRSDMNEKLGSLRFAEDTCRAAALAFEQKSFKLDANLKLLCFENGVYDLERGILRDGKPDDYISLQIPYRWEQYDPEDANQRQVMRKLEQIIPDADQRHFVLMRLAASLGANPCGQVMTLSGSGPNGKSLITDLMGKALGPYATSWSTKQSTNKVGKIRNLTKKRFINVQGQKGMKFEWKSLESLTGDPVHENGGPFISRGTFWLSVNQLPIIPADGSSECRVLVMPFKSKFVTRAENVDETNHIYLGDERLNDSQLSPQALMSILTHYYKEYPPEGLNPPKSLIEHNEKFKGIHQTFLDERCVVDGDGDGSRTSCDDLDKTFVAYAKMLDLQVSSNNMSLWLQSEDCTDQRIEHKRRLRLPQYVDTNGAKKQKITTGFTGIRIK